MQIPIFRRGGCVKKVKLGDLGKIITGNTPSKKTLEFYDSNDIPFLKPDDFKTIDEISSSKGNKNYISENARNSARIVPKNSVLVTCIGIIGKVMISESELSFNQQINAIVPNELILSKYLAYLLLYNKPKLDFISNAPVVPIINKTQFSEFEVTFHENIDVQEKIIQNLENLDNQILKRRHQSKLLSNLVKSRFNEMFGDIFDTTFPIYRLEELCEFIKDGTHQTPQYTDDRTNGFKFLSSKDVTSGKISWDNIKYITESLHNELYAKISPRRNDILLAKNGTTGIAALVDCDEIFDIYVSLAILRFYDGNNPTYLLYAINSDATKWQFESNLKGVGVPNLHLREIRKTKIPLPPLSLQNEFADFVAQVDKSQFACQMAIKLWRNSLKSSII